MLDGRYALPKVCVKLFGNKVEGGIRLSRMERRNKQARLSRSKEWFKSKTHQ